MQRSSQLQVLPALALQAMEIARDPSATLADFTAVVERDMKLATDILSLANSAIFSGGRPLASLQQAVLRLGLRVCGNLILSSSIVATMKRLTLRDEWIREILWRHGFTTGIVASHVNRVCRAGFQGEEFAAGLVHDFGRALLAVCLPDQFAAADPLDFDESGELLQHEERLLGTNHCELGAWFAASRQLPPEMVDVILCHHAPQRSTVDEKLTALVAVSDHLANHLQRFDSAENYSLAGNTGAVLLEQSGVPDAVGLLYDSATEILEQARMESLDFIPA